MIETIGAQVDQERPWLYYAERHLLQLSVSSCSMNRNTSPQALYKQYERMKYCVSFDSWAFILDCFVSTWPLHLQSYPQRTVGLCPLTQSLDLWIFMDTYTTLCITEASLLRIVTLNGLYSCMGKTLSFHLMALRWLARGLV